MTTASSRSVGYKGRTYRLLFMGATKYGQRAHLQFSDGSNDFWVAADLVTPLDARDPYAGYHASPAGQCGCSCHYGRGGTSRACQSCRFDGCEVVEAMGEVYDG